VGFFGPSPHGPGPNSVGLAKLTPLDMGESVKMNLCKFGWMNFCVFFRRFRE